MTTPKDEIAMLRDQLVALSNHGIRLREQLHRARKKRDAKHGGRRKLFAVAVDEEMHSLIRELAKKQGVTCARIVRESMEAYLLHLSEVQTMLSLEDDSLPNEKAEGPFPA